SSVGCSLHSPFTVLEERPQRRLIRLAGVEVEGVHAFGGQRAAEVIHSLLGQFGKAAADVLICSVQLNEFSALGVLDREHAYIGQLGFTQVVHVQGDQVMAAASQAHGAAQFGQGLVLVGKLEVGNQEHDGAAVGHLVGEVERADDIRATGLRFE